MVIMDGPRTCPVCGYPDLYDDPWDGANGSQEICPSCGIQFGYDDAAGGDDLRRESIYLEWRKNWLKAGAPWYSTGRVPPVGWNPRQQLMNVNASADYLSTESTNTGESNC